MSERNRDRDRNRNREEDDDSTGEESWMDASIRFFIRDQAGDGTRNVNDDDDDKEDYVEEEAIVPLSYPVENKSDSFEAHPVVVAEVITADHDERPSATAPLATIEEDLSDQNQNHNPPSPQTDRTSNNTRRLIRRCGIAKRKHRLKTGTSVSKYVVTRTSLPYTIEHNEMTMAWTAIINTSQEALDEDDTELLEETTVTISFKTIEEAREACHAYAPPRMHSFQDSPKCHICKKGFNRILRRPSHCRNCGLCVCSSCTHHWPACMLPLTYRMGKRKRVYKVCMACDWVNITFRQALLSGNHDQALALEATGNINLRNPFANMKGEMYYPVHCAVLGGNLSIFKWLVESRCCHIHSKRRMPPLKVGSVLDFEPVVTSKGKSVLDLSMESSELGILHFLIIEKGVNVMQYRNLAVALRTLKNIIHHLPESLRK